MKYLTEQRLIEFCKENFDKENIYKFNKGFKNSIGKGIRPDIVIENKKVVIEFDGYLHYTKSRTILLDREKDEIYQSNGYRVIRIPYFIQLDKISINYYFKDLIRNENIIEYSKYKYPHGFIDDKAVFPADFCSLGISRFKELMNILPKEISDSVNYSMENYKERFPDRKELEIFYLNYTNI